MIRHLFQERPHLSSKVCVASFWPWLLYKVWQVTSDQLLHEKCSSHSKMQFEMLSGMASILRTTRNCEGIIKLCTFSFNSQQIRSMDSTIMCALTLRTTFFQYKINGEPRNQEPWKQTLTGLLDTLVYWCISSWLWKLLGVSLLMPHKGDILKKRYNSCTYT